MSKWKQILVNQHALSLKQYQNCAAKVYLISKFDSTKKTTSVFWGVTDVSILKQEQSEVKYDNRWVLETFTIQQGKIRR